jgi:hypothetical protein
MPLKQQAGCIIGEMCGDATNRGRLRRLPERRHNRCRRCRNFRPVHELLRIPTKPAGYSDLKAATHSDFKAATIPI